MKQVTINTYTFNELSESAKEKARDWYKESALDFEWWDFIYEDVKTVGLKIISFDLDRNRHAKGSFIDSAKDCAERIIKEHGEPCETYKTAKAFLKDYKEDNEDQENEFLDSILEDFSIILQKESDYMQSNEYIDENILCNEYTFLENGKRF